MCPYSRSQRCVPTAAVKGAAVSKQGRLLGRQQTGDFCAAPFLRFRQCGSCRRARAGWPHALRPARHGGEEGGELRQQRLRARSALGGKEKALHRKLCGEAHWGATYARGRKCENTLELQGERAPAETPGQLIAREPWMHLIWQLSTLDKRRRRYGRAGVHTENALKQTRRQRFGVARRTLRMGTFTASHVG